MQCKNGFYRPVTEDWYGNYPDGTAVDPIGPATGKFRVARGGSFLTREASSCSSNWSSVTPIHKEDYFEFRLARIP